MLHQIVAARQHFFVEIVTAIQYFPSVTVDPTRRVLVCARDHGKSYSEINIGYNTIRDQRIMPVTAPEISVGLVSTTTTPQDSAGTRGLSLRVAPHTNHDPCQSEVPLDSSPVISTSASAAGDQIKCECSELPNRPSAASIVLRRDRMWRNCDKDSGLSGEPNYSCADAGPPSTEVNLRANDAEQPPPALCERGSAGATLRYSLPSPSREGVYCRWNLLGRYRPRTRLVC